jgi:hypothetical protein
MVMRILPWGREGSWQWQTRPLVDDESGMCGSAAIFFVNGLIEGSCEGRWLAVADKATAQAVLLLIFVWTGQLRGVAR